MSYSGRAVQKQNGLTSLGNNQRHRHIRISDIRHSRTSPFISGLPALSRARFIEPFNFARANLIWLDDSILYGHLNFTPHSNYAKPVSRSNLSSLLHTRHVEAAFLVRRDIPNEFGLFRCLLEVKISELFIGRAEP